MVQSLSLVSDTVKIVQESAVKLQMRGEIIIYIQIFPVAKVIFYFLLFGRAATDPWYPDQIRTRTIPTYTQGLKAIPVYKIGKGLNTFM